MDNNFWIQDKYGAAEDKVPNGNIQLSEAIQRLSDAAYIHHSVNSTPKEKGGLGQDGHAEAMSFATEDRPKGDGLAAFQNCEHPNCQKLNQSITLLKKLYHGLPGSTLDDLLGPQN